MSYKENNIEGPESHFVLGASHCREEKNVSHVPLVGKKLFLLSTKLRLSMTCNLNDKIVINVLCLPFL